MQCLYATTLSLSLEKNKTFIECTLHRMKTMLKCNIKLFNVVKHVNDIHEHIQIEMFIFKLRHPYFLTYMKPKITSGRFLQQHHISMAPIKSSTCFYISNLYIRREER